MGCKTIANAKLNIGISAIHVNPGKSGSHEPYMTNLVRAIAQLETQHSFTVFATRANFHLFENSRSNFNYVVYPPVLGKSFSRILSEQCMLPLETSKRNLDVLHYGGTAGSFLMRDQDVVTIHHDSNTQRASMSQLRNWYYDAVLRFDRRAGLIIVPTAAYGEQLARFYGYRHDQIQPVHHGAAPIFQFQSEQGARRAREKWGIEDHSILTITNTLPHKNVRNLLFAFELLHRQYGLDPQLVMVGNVDPQKVENLTAELSSNPHRMRNKIKIIHFLPQDQLPGIYAAASIFTFISLTETFGMPLIEAMACGLPIVASDIPVHREVLNGAARMVPPKDADDIAKAIYQVLIDKELNVGLRKAALQRSKDFSWEKTASQTIRVYERAWALSQERN